MLSPARERREHPLPQRGEGRGDAAGAGSSSPAVTKDRIRPTLSSGGNVEEPGVGVMDLPLLQEPLMNHRGDGA